MPAQRTRPGKKDGAWVRREADLQGEEVRAVVAAALGKDAERVAVGQMVIYRLVDCTPGTSQQLYEKKSIGGQPRE
jgi:hypothetical protein